MAGSHTPASARDTLVDSSPLALVSSVESGLSERLAGRVDGRLATFAEHMREGLLAVACSSCVLGHGVRGGVRVRVARRSAGLPCSVAWHHQR